MKKQIERKDHFESFYEELTKIVRRDLEEEGTLRANYVESNKLDEKLANAAEDKYFGTVAASKPQIYGIYWSKPQVLAREAESLTNTRVFLNNLWKCETEGRVHFDPNQVPVYADRILRRPPGAAPLGLSPHVDGGSVERWLEGNFAKVYRHVFSGDWRKYDPWDAAYRPDVQEIDSPAACSMFRTFQGWTALTSQGKGDGTLQVLPIANLMMYMLLRALQDDTPETDLRGAKPGRALSMQDRWYPVLSDAVTSIPLMQPGDTVFWHSDCIHAVENEHTGKGWSNVMYIGSTVGCDKNWAYVLGSSQNSWRAGHRRTLHPTIMKSISLVARLRRTRNAIREGSIEDGHMVITQGIFAAFRQCRTKSHLSLHSAAVAENLLGQAQQHWDQLYQRNGSSILRARVLDGQLYVGTPAVAAVQRQQYRVILDCTFQASDLRSRVHGLELVRSPRTKGRSAYVPIRFVSTEKISTDDKLLLAFDASVFSQACGITPPRLGKLIYGREYATITVPLAPLYTKIQSILAALSVQQTSPAPPPPVLNKHCAECRYAAQCREIATKADDLSLLAKITEKDRKKYHDKGIFTVTQLSYTFRPRRRAVERRKHEHALQALAIRKNEIHVVGPVTMKETGTPVYLDVEGDPGQDFYYCIGLRFESAGAMIQRTYWADSPSDEGTMWTECLRTLDGIDTPRLVHYGAYETTFLRQMRRRYPNPEQTGFLDQLIASAVNLLSTIYARVYFPTYSNGLKEVARYLGFRWSEPTASGLVALVWRREWEGSGTPDLKQKLITYNAEDCAAAHEVAENLLALSRSSPSGNSNFVDVTTLRREYPQRLGKAEFVLPEFQQVNNAARWDHQREKIYARSSKRVAGSHRNAPREGWTVPLNKVVECEEQRPTQCTDCGATTIYRWGHLSRTVYDFKLSGAGIKRWVVRYSFPRYICWQCKATFHQKAHQAKYGNTMCAYTVYQIIELQVTQNAVTKSMRQLFRIPASRGMVNRLKANVAERCEDMYQAILEKIVTGRLVHADETRANVAGKAAYVWVFTSLEEVAFVYSESREASTAQKVLQQFRGVLVSDFYAGYDSIACTQQKCLIHLMRDINDDLYKQPFNGEMKQIGRLFAELLRPMIDSVDRFGLKSRYLRKHRRDVQRFYQTLSRQEYQTEVAAGYRHRFEKNRDRLFTFLDYDGVPWNNNNAEHAIKAFVGLRNIIGGSSTAKGLREYLVLLSVSETCKCKGVSFLDFLLSEESGVDKLISRGRI